MTRSLRVPLLVVVVLVLVAIAVNLAGAGGRDTEERNFAAPAVPPLIMTAYVGAASRVVELSPGCTGLSWSILAGVGAVESGHARGRTLAANGDVTPQVIGPRLDGSGVGGNITPIIDTDGGALDGDVEFDRAVGPMQFLPETWTRWSRDGNGDGLDDPHNIFDAALGSAAFLCGIGPADLADRAQLIAALTRYNNSASYVGDVLAYADAYAAAPAP
ncbi:MAG: hypothetical protein M3400_17380 [Actinomycetota bacterium]|nr:hypothetical protein [Actinomycetota bacterium]